MEQTVLDKFFKKIDITPDSECLLWVGWNNGRGYGKIRINGRQCLAHRVIWEHSEGKIPDGMAIDHTCRNRACVNTAHLRLVTWGQNAVENSTGLSAANKQKTHCHKGHLFDEENTYLLHGARLCRRCHCDNQTRWLANNPDWVRPSKQRSTTRRYPGDITGKQKEG